MLLKKKKPSEITDRNGDAYYRNVLNQQAAGAFLVKNVGMLSAFGLQVLLARMLGVEEFGNYVFAVSCLNFACMAGKGGMDTASLRYVSAYHGSDRFELLNGFLRIANRSAFFFSGMIGLALLGGVLVSNAIANHHLRMTLVVVSVLLPVNALALNWNAHLRALKRVVLSQTLHEIVKPVSIGIVVLAMAYVAQLRVFAYSAMVVNFMATLAVLMITVAAYNATVPSERRAVPPRFETREWVLTAIPLLAVTGFNLVLAEADIVMLGVLGTPADAGIYAPSKKIGNLITIALSSVNAIAAPLFAELYAKKDYQMLQSTAARSAKWIFVVALPMCVAAIIMSKPILALFGPDFVAGHRVLEIIAVGQLINAATGSVGFLIMMTGHQNVAAAVMGICAAANVLLNFLLIPRFGIIGAAVAAFACNVAWNIAMLIFVVRKLGINPTAVQRLQRRIR